MYLWIDLKTPATDTWEAVLEALAPIKEYLTTTNGTGITPGPITAIGTGNTPASYFLPDDPATPSNPRYVFYDAQLSTLSQPENSNITMMITPIASAHFPSQFGRVVAEELNSTQLALLREQISFAKSKGIGARYWDQPGWPIGTRNAVWRSLINEGVSLLNVDDLADAADFWKSMG